MFFAWNFEREELWLNKMSGLGVKLRKAAVVRTSSTRRSVMGVSWSRVRDPVDAVIA